MSESIPECPNGDDEENRENMAPTHKNGKRVESEIREDLNDIIIEELEKPTREVARTEEIEK